MGAESALALAPEAEAKVEDEPEADVVCEVAPISADEVASDPEGAAADDAEEELPDADDEDAEDEDEDDEGPASSANATAVENPSIAAPRPADMAPTRSQRSTRIPPPDIA